MEGEKESRTLTNAIVFVLPPRNSRKRITPQWSLRMVDAKLLNGKAWLLHQPDRNALHLISEAKNVCLPLLNEIIALKCILIIQVLDIIEIVIEAQIFGMGFSLPLHS